MRHFPRRPRVWSATALALIAALAPAGDVRGEPNSAAGLWPTHVPGSRLAPVFLEGDDESREFVGWFDRARGESCSFRVSGDGALRCLPTDAVEARFFVDASCQHRVAPLPSCSTPKYLVESEMTQCATAAARHRVYETGATVRPTAVYARANGICQRAPFDTGAVYVAVGREVSPLSFVRARASSGSPGLALKTNYEGDRTTSAVPPLP